MQLSSNTVVILLIAAFESLWLHETSVSAAPYSIDTDHSRQDETFEERMNRLFSLDEPDEPKRKQINYFGSQTVQKNNVYEGIDDINILYGSRDVQIGNSFSGDPDAINVFGPTLIQENNKYGGKNKNAQFGASVVRFNNSFPHNIGKNFFDPMIIQTNNTYEDTIENSSSRKPDVKPSRHNYHPSKHVHSSPVSHAVLSMKIKEHEEMSKIILDNLNIAQSSSKRCANGKMNSERLDDVRSLYLEVKAQIAMFKALKIINRNRKLLCDNNPKQCSKHDHVRKWISQMRRNVTEKANRSKLAWESLRKC